MDWFDEGGNGRAVDVAALLDGPGWEALLEICQLGALIGLGTTSDGGALGVTITVDSRWRREYFRDSAELADWAAEALPAVRAAVDARPASGGPGSRRRSRRGL